MGDVREGLGFCLNFKHIQYELFSGKQQKEAAKEVVRGGQGGKETVLFKGG